MTAELEYSYIGAEFVLRVNEEIMSRAVRVKTSVKDKIERIFYKNIVSLNDEVKPVETNGLNTLIDISDENLHALNEKIVAMQTQDRVPFTVKRVVLFTNALVTKIENVSNNWFGEPVVVNRKQEQPELPSVEIANFLGGEIVPGTWDDMPEKEDVVSGPVGSIVVEPVVPVIEQTPVVSETEVTSEEPKVGEEVPAQIVPDFVPNFDELSDDSEEVYSMGGIDDKEDFVPEPKTVDAVAVEEYVPEPMPISEDIEQPVAETVSDEVEVTNEVLPAEEDVPSEDTVAESTLEEQSEEVPMSIEDKINQLLARKRETHREEEADVTKVSEAEADEAEDIKMRKEKPELTQAGIMARLQRLNNAMKEKDATIRSLSAKNDAAKEEVAQAREKITGYEAVVNDLTMKNSSLTKENERLAAKVEDAETESQSTIARLEAQVEELTVAKAKESEKADRKITILRDRHVVEIAKLKEKQAKELAAVNETKEKQIQAIYATITEALGETVDEAYEEGPKLAA